MDERGPDHRLLDEVAEDHAQMIEDVMRTCKQYEFMDRNQAYGAQQGLLVQALSNLGVILPSKKNAKVNPKFIEKRMNDKHVKIMTMQSDKHRSDRHMWMHNAIGVYDTSVPHDELIYFISAVKSNNPSQFDRVRRAQRWAIRTNVEASGRKTVSVPENVKKDENVTIIKKSSAMGSTESMVAHAIEEGEAPE